MKQLLFFVAILLFGINVFAQHEPIQPYEDLGIKVKVLTLSDGKYQESFPNDTILPIGSILFNRVTGEVVSIIDRDTLYGECDLQPEIVSRWLSPDPLAADFPSWSPYNFVFNNPLIFIDPDGMAPDYIVDGDGNRLDIQVQDNQLVYGENVPQEVQNTLNAMWQTETGQGQVSHLLNTNAAIEVNVSENVGAYYVDGKYYAVYGSTGPAPDQNNKLIKDYDGGKVHTENTLTLFKGTFEYGTGDKTKLDVGKVTVIDPISGKDVSGDHQGKVSLEPSQNPDLIYKNSTQFYNLAGVHETEHTKSANIKLKRRRRDAEAPAYKIENKSRSELKN